MQVCGAHRKENCTSWPVLWPLAWLWECRAGVKLERGPCIKASAMSEKAYANSLSTLQNALGVRYSLHYSAQYCTVQHSTVLYCMRQGSAQSCHSVLCTLCMHPMLLCRYVCCTVTPSLVVSLCGLLVLQATH